MRRDTVETCTRIISATLPIENFCSVTFNSPEFSFVSSFITRTPHAEISIRYAEPLATILQIEWIVESCEAHGLASESLSHESFQANRSAREQLFFQKASDIWEETCRDLHASAV